jgi:exopolyphosphatase/guanosine-5'-triphosphate,3'-diphosphate pyrophosphatase
MLPKKHLAVIDLGSNTAILLIMKRQAPLQVVHEEFRIPRLAEGLFPGKDFSPTAVERACEVLREFRQLCEQHDAELVCCGGTAPFRKVHDVVTAIDYFYRHTGVTVTSLNEEQEAYCAYLSAVALPYKNKALPKIAHATVIDIGGGSCEIAWGSGETMQGFHSAPSGCVDCTEQLLPMQLKMQGNSDTAEIAHAEQEIIKRFPKLAVPIGSTFFAVAGTPVTLALLELNVHRYAPELVDGQVVSLASLQQWRQKMGKTPLANKIGDYGIPPGRAEVLLSGLMILETVMRQYHFKDVVVRNAGLRYGLALQVLSGTFSQVPTA